MYNTSVSSQRQNPGVMDSSKEEGKRYRLLKKLVTDHIKLPLYPFPQRRKNFVRDGKQRQGPFIFSHKPQNKCVKCVSLFAKKIHLLLAKYP